MTLFLKKTLSLILLVITTHSLLYIALSSLLKLHKTSNSIYIYGDSQTVQGIDLEELNKVTGCNIHSAATHGAGIYDFLVFVNSIPSDAKVILSISKLAQIRPNINEANNSPFNLSALIYLLSSGYDKASFKNILMRNIKLPYNKYYKSEVELYPNKDTITIKQSLDIFKKRYSISQKNLNKKQRMYLDGIKKLIAKGCRVTFIEFPLHKTLSELDNNFPYKSDFYKFKKDIFSICPNLEIDSINLPTDINYMYDYSHLNQYGSNLATNILAKKLNKRKQFTTMYIVH